ncbi:MAG: hypothetical protein M4D80_00145 [Myxococcota bacterium]|nr:hypothetical protein [Myxococcota bacterium]
MRQLLLALPILMAPQVASADEVTVVKRAEPAMYDFGARIGGYGFRREGDNSDEGWTECQMGGIGMFASRRLTGPLFLEAGLDAYTSRNEGLPQDLPVSRMSGLATLAAGARTNFTSWLRGYAQLGGGVELTRVSVPYGEDETIRDTKVMPAGFIGFGVDIRLGKKTYVGMNVRTLMMGNFNYKREELEMEEAWGFTTPSEDTVFDASLDFAAQGQFFIRRDL